MPIALVSEERIVCLNCQRACGKEADEQEDVRHLFCCVQCSSDYLDRLLDADARPARR